MTLPIGLHYDVPESVYRADPCVDPSLTQSIAKLILRSPAHARVAHPRLNPNWERGDDRKYDVGTIAHRLLLGRGRELVVIEGDDWVADRKAKSEAREEALAAGKLAILSRDYELGQVMAKEAFRQLAERGYANDWHDEPHRAEVVGVAKITAANSLAKQEGSARFWGDYWLRCMIDWLPSLIRPWDYKTTSASAAPDAVSHRMIDGDWIIQAAMHERILDLLDTANIGRRQHRFVVQEAYEPFALVVVRLTEAHMTVGRRQLARAESIWAECIATGHWPAYPREDQSPEFPSWAAAKVMEDDNDD